MAEQLPPMGGAELVAALKNSTWSSYLYVGKASDKGWKNAVTAEGFLARVRVYQARDKDALDGSGISVTAGKPGVVFGWGETPVKRLTKTQCADLGTVMQAIVDGQKS